MLKGYAKPIVFSMLVGLLMLTGVYSYAVQQTGVVPIFAVLANDNNQFYMVIIEAQLPNYQTVNYTLTPENATAYIPAGSTIKRLIPYINVTEPYIDTNCFYIDTTVVKFTITWAINGVDAGIQASSITAYLLATNEDCTVATLYGNGWVYRSLSHDQVWEFTIRAISYLV